MATFKSYYTTSELLKVIERRSLFHYYWSCENDEYTFYFVDNRRLPRFNLNGLLHIYCHKSNYYRLRNKINLLPFRLDFLKKSANLYSFDLVPDSCFINDGACFKLLELNAQYKGNLIVRVVVI